MNVSKFSISQETMNRLNKSAALTSEQKKRIRTDGVKALIRSKPSGHMFKIIDLIKAAGYHPEGWKSKGYQHGYAFVSSLWKKGEITKTHTEGFLSSFIVNEDIVTIKKKAGRPKKQVAIKEKAVEIEEKANEIEEVVEKGISESLIAEDYAILKKELAAADSLIKELTEQIRTPIEEKADTYAGKAEIENHKDQLFSFNLTINKKNLDGNFGRLEVAQISMNDVKPGQISYLIENVIDNIS